MASILRIKRSETAGNPSTLGAGELAYSALADNGSNGGDRLYIGMGTETTGNAVNHIIIGGKYYTGLIDAGGSGGTLNTTAKSVPVLSATGTIDQWLVGNLKLTSNTLSSTDANGNINITPNGTGKTVISNVYIGDTSTTLQEYIFDQVGGTITAGTGITSSFNDAGNTTTLSISNTTVTAGTYGSATAIPVFTVNAQGQLTAATTANIATSLNIAGDTGTDAVALLTETLTFVGGTGLTSTVTNNTVTIDIDNTVATLSGTQTLTNKTINLTSNTLVATSAQLAAAVSDETGSGSLVFATSPTLVTPTLGAALATSITATAVAGSLLLAAAAGNNNVNLTPTGTGTVDVGGKRITSLADPSQATDAATKQYVDAVKTGLNVKDAVRIATTANLTATYNNNTTGVGATLTNSGTQAALVIDSQPLVVGDRVLVKDQTATLQNGIYTVTTVGTVSTNWVLTRATDFDNSVAGEIGGGDFVFVQEGTINADNGYVVTTDGTITVGTTGITWVQFSGAGSVVAGDGLTKSGNTLNAVGTANRITVNADSIDIASTYVGQTSITTLGTITAGTWNATIINPTYGGTGVNNGSKTITLGGSLTTSGAFDTTLTVTAATSVTLPTTGTLATLAGTEALSNKTITLSSFSGTTITASGLVTFTNNTASTSTSTGALVVTGGVGIGGKLYVGSNLVGAGAATSTLDGFNIDGGTY